MATERLHHRENHATIRRRHRVAFQIIEAPIHIGFFIGIQAVEVHHLEQRLAIDIALGDIVEFGAGGIGKVFYIEFKIGRLHLIGT